MIQQKAEKLLSLPKRTPNDPSAEGDERRFFDYLESLVGEEYRLPVAALLNLLRSASLLSKKIEQQMLEYGLSTAKYNVLRVLLHPGPGRDPREGLLMKQIARLLIVSEQNITSLIDGLEAQGLVQRAPCPSDRRATIVRATPAGKQLMKEVMPVQTRRAAQLVQSLTRQEQEALVRALTRLRSATITTMNTK